MNNEKYINNITLEYLLNPILYEKINDTNNKTSNKLILDDILFYRQRICKLTKDMCKDNYTNNNLKNIFMNYATAIVYYLKQLDEQDILQSEYDNLQLTDNEHLDSALDPVLDPALDPTLDPSLDPDLDPLKTFNNILINKPTVTKNLDNFVKRINVEPIKQILPKKRVVNINNPSLKTKGIKPKKIKEKSYTNIDETFKE